MKVSEVKPNYLKRVKWNGTEYLLVGYKMEYVGRKTLHSGILMDIRDRVSSRVIVLLDQIETVEGRISGQGREGKERIAPENQGLGAANEKEPGA